jgi:hypothetical protein
MNTIQSTALVLVEVNPKKEFVQGQWQPDLNLDQRRVLKRMS